MAQENIRTIDVLGVPIDAITVEQLHAQMATFIDRNEHRLVLNVNVHCLNLAHQNPWLHDFLNQADIVFCDGAGVMLAAKILGDKIPERITYADWMWQVGEFAAQRGYTFYFLGARPTVAEKAATALKDRFPSLQIVGTQDGFFDHTTASPENESIIRAINKANPDILILGMGMPLQERWLMENWERLNVNVGLTGGAVFDYVSGELQRGPAWMTDRGFEWLARLFIEPRRLWRRYVLGNPQFLLRVYRQKYGARRMSLR